MKKEYEALYQTKDDAGEALKRLAEIIKILRVECPWDKVQTHESLTRCMVEEAYEAVDAIMEHDTANLREELGDVLLQVVFHSNLSENEGDFNLADVINEECEKMIRRHPHIFSENKVKDIDKALEKWENMKCKEHNELKNSDRLRRVPRALPALIRSEKVQAKAAMIGFDWDDDLGAFAKIDEELRELMQAYDRKDADAISEELGDLLFSVVNVARFLNADPEESLHNATAKFIRRFTLMEAIAEEKHLDFTHMCLEELDNLWQEAKEKEKFNA